MRLASGVFLLLLSTLIFCSTSNAHTFSSACMRADKDCSRDQEARHHNFHHYMDDKIDGIFSDDDEFCESVSSFSSRLKRLGFSIAKIAAEELIITAGGALAEAAFGIPAEDVHIALSFQNFVEEQKTEGNCD